MEHWVDLFEEHHLVVTNFELFVCYLLFGWWGIFLRVALLTWMLWGEFEINELIDFFTPKKKSVLFIVFPWLLFLKY